MRALVEMLIGGAPPALMSLAWSSCVQRRGAQAVVLGRVSEPVSSSARRATLREDRCDGP